MSKYRHPIYGVNRRVVIRPETKIVSSTPFCYDPCPGALDAFIALELTIFNIQRALQQYYQPQRAVSDFIANMTARCSVPPVVYVRLAWREANKGVAFDINNAIHRLQIKDIYLYFGFEYRNDPLFKDPFGLTLV